ncbi:hypothetical protein [Methylobacterium sp. B1]|uniref:hypothetical protein n=1 Tax=Methylobacterium sp. B1 TaxID=91459 RepID=UPI00034B67B9|nr:hypothetical protein [Methylobacterium sp. B1]
MKLKKVYDTEAEIPEEAAAFYEERDGKWHLTLEIEGSASQDDVTRLNGALAKERNDHRATREKLRAFGELDPERTRQVMDRIGDLGEWDEVERKLHRLDGDGSTPKEEAAIQARIDAEVQRRERAIKAPLERQITQLTEARAEIERERDEARGTLRGRAIADALREAAGKARIIPSAVEDVLLAGERVFDLDEQGRVVTKDNVGVAPGLTPDAWLTDLQEKRPHWWPTSEGAGSRGNRGGGTLPNNPFTAEAWNVTEQGRIAAADFAKADRLAKAAGTTVGGPKPAPRNRAA